jgi:hypothetical protein
MADHQLVWLFAIDQDDPLAKKLRGLSRGRRKVEVVTNSPLAAL